MVITKNQWRSHHGDYSAKLTTNGNGGYERAYSYRTVAAAPEVYARAYFFVSTSGLVENGDSAALIILRANTNTVAYAGWRRTGGATRWYLMVRDGAGYATTYSSSSPVVGRWYCLELRWRKGQADGLGEVWVGGTQVCSVTGRNTASYGDADTARFGIAEAYNCGVTRVYADCCAVSYFRIGIEPA